MSKPMLARDYRGKRVRLTNAIRTKGGATYPDGHVMVIRKKHGGTFNLECPPGCKLIHRPKQAGDVGTVAHYVTKVSKYSVQLL